MHPIQIKRVETAHSPEAKQFIQLPFDIYPDSPFWVPWFNRGMMALLSREHPLFNHSEGDFFIALRGDKILGRIFVFENTQYNQTHKLNSAHFFFFDVHDDQDASRALLQTAIDWTQARDLEILLGPMGLGGVTGGGLLIEGFEHRAAMTMMLYNHPYYRQHLEAAGFTKYIDNFSFYLPTTAELPPELGQAADHLLATGKFEVLQFKTKDDLLKVAQEVVAVFIETLSPHVGNYVLSSEELAELTDSLVQIADPELVKVITYEGRVIGFLFAFHDLSAAMQKNRGHLHPYAMLRLKREYKKADWILVNGMGILPEYQGTGANFLLYAEIEKTIRNYPKFKHLEMVQIQETTAKMLSNVKTLNGKIHKVHRIYQKRM